MKKSLYSFLTILIIILIVTGCKSDIKADKIQTNSSRNNINTLIKNGTVTTVKRKTPYENNFNRSLSGKKNINNESNDSISTLTEKLAQGVSGIVGIEKASVIIVGNVAIVGISLSGEPDEKTIVRLKKEAEHIIKINEPNIARASVTADEKLFKRIESLSNTDKTKKMI